jgi:hypothetical protein
MSEEQTALALLSTRLGATDLEGRQVHGFSAPFKVADEPCLSPSCGSAAGSCGWSAADHYTYHGTAAILADDPARSYRGIPFTAPRMWIVEPLTTVPTFVAPSIVDDGQQVVPFGDAPYGRPIVDVALPVVRDGKIMAAEREHIIVPEPKITIVEFKAPVDPRGLPADAAALKHELIEQVRAYSAADPRSLQKTIGPSEIGDPCDSRVIRTALGMESLSHPDPWASFVGTATHARLADVFESVNKALGVERYLTERRVYVTDGISGCCDLYRDGLVIDHKVMGTETHREIRLRGFENNAKYRVQGHLYGLGWERAGFDVQTVAVAAWKRSGFLDDLHIQMEPYNRVLAEQALDRLSMLVAWAADNQADERDEPWLDIATAPGKGCGFCPFYDPLASKNTRMRCKDGREYQSDKGAGRGPRGDTP